MADALNSPCMWRAGSRPPEHLSRRQQSERDAEDFTASVMTSELTETNVVADAHGGESTNGRRNFGVDHLLPVDLGGRIRWQGTAGERAVGRGRGFEPLLSTRCLSSRAGKATRGSVANYRSRSASAVSPTDKHSKSRSTAKSDPNPSAAPRRCSLPSVAEGFMASDSAAASLPA
jgi:hypothetical protein